MTTRFALVSAPLLLCVLCAAPSFAQDIRKRQQQEIEELRARLTKADDEMLEMARRFDKAKWRLQVENESLLKEVARLKRANALLEAKVASLGGEKGGAKKDAFLDDKTLTLNFPGTPLSEVADFLRDVTGANLTISSKVPDDAVITLRIRDMTFRNALDQICDSARTADGKGLPLKWRVKSGVIQITKQRTKSKKKK